MVEKEPPKNDCLYIIESQLKEQGKEDLFDEFLEGKRSLIIGGRKYRTTF